MIPIPSLSDTVNLHYYKWVTSHDETVKHKSLIVFYSKLRILTRIIIKRKYRNRVRIFEDIFSDMIYKVCYSKHNNLIGTTESFCSWYRKVLKNYMTNLHRDRKRMKRKLIEYESDFYSPENMDKIEVAASFENYMREEWLTEVKDIVSVLMKNLRDNQLLYDRYVLGVSETILAQQYQTTVNGIKSRLKRAKKQMQVTYAKIGKIEYL